MSDFTTFTANEVLDHVFRNTAYTAAATVYAGLYTTATSDAGGGTEVTGGSYARVALTFSAASAGAITTSGETAFVQATANWGTITHGAVLDALTSGNMLAHSALDSSKVVDSGDTFKYNAGEVDVSLT